MSEAILTLLLTGGVGLSLPGTLRYDYADTEATVLDGDLAALLAAPVERPRAQVAVVALAGTLSVPLLTSARDVALTGVALVTAAGPITTLLRSGDGSPRVDLHFNPIDFQNLAGGLIWRAGQPGQHLFSLLGKPLSSGGRDTDEPNGTRPDVEHRSDHIARIPGG